MLRATYDFRAPYENTLSFDEGDLFITLKKNNKDNDWVHVVDLKGVVGYVSRSFIRPLPVAYNLTTCSVT